MPVPRHLYSIEDLGADGILRLLDRSEEIARGSFDPGRLAGKVLGLLFFQPSTRTRFGFHAAVARFGGTGGAPAPPRGAPARAPPLGRRRHRPASCTWASRNTSLRATSRTGLSKTRRSSPSSPGASAIHGGAR